MKVALIGFMQSGKSTLLAAISGKDPALSGATSVDEAVVMVPDERLDWLTSLYEPKKTVHATIDCLDFPGLSFVDSAGRGAAKRLIEQVRGVDMFVLVVRGFENDQVPPYRSTIDPLRDVLELQSEFLLADLALVLTRIENLQKQVTRPSASQERDKTELALQLVLQEALEAGRPVRTVIENEEQLALVRSLGLLTMKPITIVVNVGEGDLGTKFDFSTHVDSSVPVVVLCAKLESELSSIDLESRAEFMADLGISESAASKFVRGCYEAVGLISFLTVGPDEVRAWPVPRAITALDAAGKIHTDIKRGFIRAETMAYQELKELGSEKALKAAGRVRLEGKTYEIQDGDIINFRFNV